MTNFYIQQVPTAEDMNRMLSRTSIQYTQQQRRLRARGLAEAIQFAGRLLNKKLLNDAFNKFIKEAEAELIAAHPNLQDGDGGLFYYYLRTSMPHGVVTLIKGKLVAAGSTYADVAQRIKDGEIKEPQVILPSNPGDSIRMIWLWISKSDLSQEAFERHREQLAEQATQDQHWHDHLKDMLGATLSKPEVRDRVDAALEDGSSTNVNLGGTWWAGDTDTTGNGPVGGSWGDVEYHESDAPVSVRGRQWRVANYDVYPGAFGFLFLCGTVGVFCDTSSGESAGVVIFQSLDGGATFDRANWISGGKETQRQGVMIRSEREPGPVIGSKFAAE